MCCVMHVKEPTTLIVKEKGLAPVFLDSCLEHPAGWICACYKSSVLLLLEQILINAIVYGISTVWLTLSFLMALMSSGVFSDSSPLSRLYTANFLVQYTLQNGNRPQ